MAMGRRQKKITIILILIVAIIVGGISVYTIPGQADAEVKKKVFAADSAATITERTMHFSTSHLFVFRYKIVSPATGYKAVVWHAIPHNEIVFEK